MVHTHMKTVQILVWSAAGQWHNQYLFEET